MQQSHECLGPRPRVAVIGGGTGSYTVLRGLRQYDLDLSAVVSVMDNGGSSGRLRDEFGQLPAGDLRRCLVALGSDDHAGLLLRRLFEYRFDRGEGLSGHSFGNLLLTALTDISGNLEGAIAAATQILNVRGNVIPVTLDNVHLCAELVDGTIIRGETAIDVRVVRPDIAIRRVFLDRSARPNQRALAAIDQADVIVIGPGDLYTSLIPNLLVGEIATAVSKSSALKVLVTNLMTKKGETDGFVASDFAREICGYLGINRLDAAIVSNSSYPRALAGRYADEGSYPVAADLVEMEAFVDRIIGTPLLAEGSYARHDRGLLASAVVAVIESVCGAGFSAAAAESSRASSSNGRQSDPHWRPELISEEPAVTSRAS